MPDASQLILEEKKKRLISLIQDYTKGSEQLRNELDDVNRSKIENRLKVLEREIHALEKEIGSTDLELDISHEFRTNDTKAICIKKYHLINESFPFTNRKDEIEDLLSSFSPPYVLLDAPAGFGKTQLLIELGKRFAERNWIVVYTRVLSTTTPKELAQEISSALFVRGHFSDALSIGMLPGEAFGVALHHYWRDLPTEDPPYEGFVLLIDSVDANTESLFLDLYSSFVQEAGAVLRTLKYFSEDGKLRIILGGRHLAHPLSQATLKSEVRHLSPFTFEVVQDALTNYLNDHDLEGNKQLASHLFYLTGGHPGCYASCVKDFVSTPQEPDRYFERSITRLWKNFVEPYTNWATTALESFAEIMEQLSLFRLCNNFVLESVIAEMKIIKDPHDLADELTGAFLLHRHGRFLKDNIIRRLLAIKMRFENPDKFLALCRSAQEVCSNQILQPKVQSPELWVIEYLFLRLQEIAHLREKDQEFLEKQESFFDVTLTSILKKLVNHRGIPKSHWREERDSLKFFVQKDWEFQFMLNYAFRNPNFDDKPYEMLCQRINAFFTQ